MSESKINNGGLAFPFTPTDRSGQIGECNPGMSYRQWLIGRALSGYTANPLRDDLSPEELASQCIGDADAIIKALEKEES